MCLSPIIQTSQFLHSSSVHSKGMCIPPTQVVSMSLKLAFMTELSTCIQCLHRQAQYAICLLHIVESLEIVEVQSPPRKYTLPIHGKVRIASQ